MLLKCTADGRRIKVNSSALPGNVTGARASGMKMTMSTTPTMTSRVHRKVMRAPHKRAHPGKLQHYPGKMALLGGKPHLVSKYGSSKLAHYARLYSGKPHASRGKLLPHAQASRLPDPCDNSNDSGLGPDRDAAVRFSDAANSEWSAAAASAAVDTMGAEAKRRRMEIKYESDDANDNYSFPELQRPPPPPTPPAHSALSNSRADCSSIPSPAMSQSPGKLFGSTYRSHGKLASAGKMASKLSSSAGKFGSGKIASSGKLANALARRRALATSTQTGPPTLSAHLPSMSRDGRVQLQIVCQPETQHRARYQTEGSRGAVKDNSGNGFPIVKLVGYDKPAVLEVFIGTDTGRVAPHMFYQACRVSGKNSTPCKERKEDGTVLIEIELDPAKNWQVTCDCVGILKERNVDVEHRFGEAGSGASGPGSGGAVSRGKKKSTRCRMVFRTQVLNPDGTSETLQVSSSQIICTQPPGVPEISLKSLASCPASGGFNLVLLGKNFLKDTRVVLLHTQDSHTLWEEHVVPYKDFLTQTHVACCVPAYARTDIAEPVPVQLYVLSGGKASESHSFYYTPLETGPQPTPCTSCARHAGGCSDEARPVMLWGSGAAGGGGMMPPPALPPRRPSLILPDPHSPLGLKSELHDESSQHSLLDHSETSNMSFVNENSCDAHLAHSDISGDHTSNSSDALLRSRLVALGGPSSQLLMSDEMKVVDLRLKSESMEYARYAPSIKLSPPSSEPPEPDPSPLASFTRQLQAIHTQVQTDKMVESVTAALFQENAARIYSDPPILIEDNFNADIKAINSDLLMRDAPMKTMNPELMMRDASMPPPPPLAPQGDPAPDSRLLGFVPYGAVQDSARSLSEQTAQMEALVDDAMQTSGEMLPSDAAKLEALVNSTVENHMCAESSATSASASHATDVLMSPAAGAAVVSGDMRPPLPSSAAISPDVILNPQVSPSLLTPMMQAPPPSQDELMLMSEPMQMPTAVKTPPAAVKSMILNAAAEILTSDSAMNALVTSAINTANILTTESASAATAMTAMTQSSPQPADGLQADSSPEAPMSAMSQAVSQAVTQAVSQAVSHAVSQAVSQEMTAPVQGLTDMSDSDLLSYINPSAFDQV